MKRFNHLNVPQHWEQYWDKYPQGYTILEALMQWVQQVDNMVDSHNSLAKSVTNYREEMDDFVKQFNPNLQVKVIEVLKDWQNSGFLEVVLNEALQSQIDDVDNRLSTEMEHKASEKTTESIGVFNWWKPPTQPSFNSSEPNYDGNNAVPLNNGTTNYSTIMDKLWEKFANDPTLSGYVKRKVHGKDQSGNYDIYRYVFEPEGYEKTIVMTIATHGWERAGVGALSRFMHHVCYDYKEYPQLEYIRKKVRVVIMPFCNPYGYTHGNIRQNSRGVDINRNFPYKWEGFRPTENYPGGYDWKGQAAASEIETQYIINTLTEFNDAVAYIDWHNMSGSSPTFHFYTPLYEANAKGIADKIYPKFSEYICKEGGTAEPNAFNYGAKIDMNSSNPEFVVGAINSEYPYGSLEMTKWVEFAGNVILKYLELEKPSFEFNKEPFSLYLDRTWLAGAGWVSPTPTTYQEVAFPTYEFLPPCDGIVSVTMEVVFSNSDATSRNFFTPLLGQNNTSIVASQRLTNFEIYKDTIRNDARDHVTLSAAIPVRKDEFGQYVKVGLWARNTAGIMEISRIRANIHFTPSSGAKRQQILFVNSSNNWANVGFNYNDI